jgi:hypothetical protein
MIVLLAKASQEARPNLKLLVIDFDLTKDYD